MDTVSFLANLLLSVTVGTLTVAFVAYLAYGLRERRKPSGKKTEVSGDDSAPIFLRLYVPERDGLPAVSARTADYLSGHSR